MEKVLQATVSCFMFFINCAALLFCVCVCRVVSKSITVSYPFLVPRYKVESFSVLHILKVLISYLFRDLKMSQHVQLKAKSLKYVATFILGP